MDQASDAVFPIHEFDASAALHDVYCVFLRFDSVVDAPKLKTALWRVLEVGDWRKLGGRVRQKVSIAPWHGCHDISHGGAASILGSTTGDPGVIVVEETSSNVA